MSRRLGFPIRSWVDLPHFYNHSNSVTFQVEHEMSIGVVNNVQEEMTVDPLDDALISSMDNTVSGKTRTIHSPSMTAS